jgi:hypothetical protein
MNFFCLLIIDDDSFRILITGGTSGLVETITDAVSIHSIKKAEYARRLAAGRLGHVSLFDHFRTVSIKSKERYTDVDFDDRHTATHPPQSLRVHKEILRSHLRVCTAFAINTIVTHNTWRLLCCHFSPPN